MTPSLIASHRQKEKTEKIKSVIAFVIVVTPFPVAALIMTNTHPVLSQLIYFFSGWLTWTYLEYLNHRFRMHGKGLKEKVPGYASHMNHHHHPTEIRILSHHRWMLLAGNLLLIVLCIWFGGVLAIVTGIYSGFVLYLFMHVVLHQKWSAKLLPKLQDSHIHHHCKYPNHCFGVSVTWWDQLLHTVPPKDATISHGMREFFFREQHHVH